MAKDILLGKGYVTVVDDEDFERFQYLTWSRFAGDRTDYAVLWTGRHSMIWLHREILGTPFQVDHIDGDGLNNRRANLRLASTKENNRNTRLKKTNTSGYKGVSCTAKQQGGRKWKAQICCDYKRVQLGYFHSPEEAAEAYDSAAIRFFGEFARTNAMLGLLPKHLGAGRVFPSDRTAKVELESGTATRSSC